MTCDREVYHLNPGDMIALLPKKLHSIGGSTPERKRYFVLKFDLNRFHDTSGIMPQLKSSILQAATDPKAFIHFPNPICIPAAMNLNTKITATILPCMLP